MRIATWNVERPGSCSSERSQRITDKIGEINADIWILTETNDSIIPGTEFSIASTPTIVADPIYHRQGEHKTSIWSRWPIVEVFRTATPHRAICAILNTPDGKLMVYGTVFPYHGAKWPYGTTRNWDAHYAAIATQAADWIRLRREHPDAGFCIGGDFNQYRPERRNYGTRWGRLLLDLALAENSLTGITQIDFPAAWNLSGKDSDLLEKSIDHICMDSNWAESVKKVAIWPGKSDDNGYLSDHCGVFVDLKIE